MHLAVVVGRSRTRIDELVVEALVIPLEVVVLEVFAEHASPLPESSASGAQSCLHVLRFDRIERVM